MPKPHLVSYRERVAIDGEPIDADAFAAMVERVLPAIDRVARATGPPTEFEALTAAAISELARREVDLAIVEVGMGGRLDATNVLDLGVAVITNVQRDHEAYLGTTLTKIGGEKAPIIKAGDLAVTGATGRGLRPILDRCAALDVPLRRAGRRQAYRARVVGSGWQGITVDARTPTRRLADLRIGLLGAHQADNAAVALAVLEALSERWNIAIGDDAIRAGLAAARWPGRLELLDGGPHGRVLLDGAHNPAGAAALATALADLGLQRPIVVFGAMRGKKVRAVLRALAPLDPRFIFTRVNDPKAFAPDALAAAWRAVSGQPSLTASTARDALTMAYADPVVVAGSLYLVGEVRGILTGTAEDA
jgi:dihydrofolate synthase/folylpolyglutamate synthase